MVFLGPGVGGGCAGMCPLEVQVIARLLFPATEVSPVKVTVKYATSYKHEKVDLSVSLRTL